jgi:hypothetical protein
MINQDLNTKRKVDRVQVLKNNNGSILNNKNKVRFK